MTVYAIIETCGYTTLDDKVFRSKEDATNYLRKELKNRGCDDIEQELKDCELFYITEFELV